MTVLILVGIILASYLLGSIPVGLIVVWLINGKDIRRIASGRTGGTNAMRAAGTVAGIATAVFDGLKGASAVWLARALMPGNSWIAALAPMMAILGHNFSIFLLERGHDDRPRLRGGAGGAPCVGGAFALWPPSILIILPVGAAIWYGLGFASITTISIGLMATGIFAFRAITGASPWEYVGYGVAAELAMLWALRPNLVRLWKGTERLNGWRATKKKGKQEG
jgi:acyl phosphate:glycerol-3-phosphate acyltransferase